jgi:hypothetical protein
MSVKNTGMARHSASWRARISSIEYAIPGKYKDLKDRDYLRSLSLVKEIGGMPIKLFALVFSRIVTAVGYPRVQANSEPRCGPELLKSDTSQFPDRVIKDVFYSS